MVLSHLESSTGMNAGPIRDFATANQNYAEISMDVTKISENDPRATLSNGQEMAVNVASRDCPKIVEVSIRHENQHTESYSWETMTKKRCRRMVQQVCEFASAKGERAGYDGCRSPETTNFLRSSFAFVRDTEKHNGNQILPHSDSSDSSSGVRTPSDSEDVVDDPMQSTRRKRAKRSSSESKRILGGPERGNLEKLSILTRISLMISDEGAVVTFYRRILADGQQLLCKKLAKWWIRAINPNKQSNYPYARGTNKKPPWWPSTPPNNAVGEPTKGTTANGFVRHKEPDHLAKPERLTLLPYILNQVTEPRNRSQFNWIDVTKLQQISMDSINNETTDTDKHDSWRRFVAEIFRVALMQERFKNGEIDDTTQISVLASFDNWRHKGAFDDPEDDSKSDGAFDDDEGYDGKDSLESLPNGDPHIHGQIHPQPLGDDIKREYSSFGHDTRSRLNFQNGTSDQQSYGRLIDIPNQTPGHQVYNAPTASLPRSYQHPNATLQETFHRHSDTSDRFPIQSPFIFSIPSNKVADVTNRQYQTLQTNLQISATSNGPNGHVLPPLPAFAVRPLEYIPHFPENEFFPRPSTTFQAPVRSPMTDCHRNLHQLSQQHESFQDYLENEEYGHNASKMQVMNINHASRSEFTYDQENDHNVSRTHFSYSVKPQCSLEPSEFDLDDMANGESNGHSEHILRPATPPWYRGRDKSDLATLLIVTIFIICIHLLAHL